jgi:sugar phosphate isomerase/epimerase
LDRKAFLSTIAATSLAGLGLAGCREQRAAAGSRALDPLGVQLYTVRDRMAQDVAGTLRAVADVGYREVETAGLFDLSPDQFRAALDAAGLVSPAGHFPIDAVRQGPAATLDVAQTLGQGWIVVPWLDEAERTADGYSRLADDLNSFAAIARDRDIRVAYHNHDFEFAPLDDGRTGYDLLLERTDPELVDLELDLFWTVKGGHDPIALFSAHPGRFALCHVKDMADTAGAQRMVPVGDGEIDFSRIFAHAAQAGLRHYFVEHDDPRDSIASIRTSFDHLQQLSF